MLFIFLTSSDLALHQQSCQKQSFTLSPQDSVTLEVKMSRKGGDGSIPF